MRRISSFCLILVLSLSLVDCDARKPPTGKDGGVPEVVTGQEKLQEPVVGQEPAAQEPVEGREPAPRQEPAPRSEPSVEPRTSPEPSLEPQADASAPEGRQSPEPGPEPPPTSDTDPKFLAKVTCATTPPAGSKLAAAPPKYSGGTCPTLKSGANTIKTAGGNRKFLLVLPNNIQPNEKLPVLFMWHWLKGKANSFLSKGDVQKSADQQRFIAVIPEKKGDLKAIVVDVPWPFLASVPQKRYDEEFTFFDDMLACVAKQYNINKECVATAGVSAGALFSAQLAVARSQHLSSLLSLSGGVNESVAAGVERLRPWKTTPHRLPALILWGGSLDSCVLLNFEKASKELQKALAKDGHFFLECVHNCGHSEPPLTANPGKSRYESLWDFFLRHPFWLKPGDSPYKVVPWPYTNLNWCGVGAGSATQRTGKCGEPGCPI